MINCQKTNVTMLKTLVGFIFEATSF